MVLRTLIRDCLYLNWALPVSALPPLPEPLRYETHAWRGEPYSFASALLFRNERLHLAAMPLVRLTYPQFNLRLCVLDGEGVPSVFFRCLLVPGWVLPSARYFARQPVASGSFAYPRPSNDPAAAGWSWSVRRRRRLEVSARQSSPLVGEGPSLGSWEQATTYFIQRRRGYAQRPGGLKKVDATHRPGAVWPVEVTIEDGSLLEEFLPLDGLPEWPRPHSAWLCPEIPLVFELGTAALRAGVRRSTAPVAADPAMFIPRPPEKRGGSAAA